MKDGWLIVKTHQRVEELAGAAIRRLGFAAWVPTIKGSCRNGNGRYRAIPVSEHKLIPGRLFAEAPVAREADLLEIRHVVAIQKDADLTPIQVPAIEVLSFCEEVEQYNREVMALARIGKTPKNKRKWVDLQEGLRALLKEDQDGKT